MRGKTDKVLHSSSVSRENSGICFLLDIYELRPNFQLNFVQANSLVMIVKINKNILPMAGPP